MSERPEMSVAEYDRQRAKTEFLKWTVLVMIPIAIFCFVGFHSVMWAVEATMYLDQCRIELRQLR